MALVEGARVLDLGCGPASITLGLAEAVGPSGAVIGLDMDPGPAPVPLVRGDAYRLPFAGASFDAVFSCAVMQHLVDPLGVLIEARRVCRPGAVIGVADADWGGIREPDDPLLVRGEEILVRLRGGASPYVGRRLRGLLTAAGFVEVAVAATGVGGGDAQSIPFKGAAQAAMFEAPETVAVVVEEGIATADEMAAVAAAWRRWADDPAAVLAGSWFEATGRAPAEGGA